MRQRAWPKNPAQLGIRIKRIAPALREVGVQIENAPAGRDKAKRRGVRISQIADEQPGRRASTGTAGTAGTEAPETATAAIPTLRPVRDRAAIARVTTACFFGYCDPASSPHSPSHRLDPRPHRGPGATPRRSAPRGPRRRSSGHCVSPRSGVVSGATEALELIDQADLPPGGGRVVTLPRFAFYGRLSTDDKQDQTLARPSQLEACRRKAAELGGEIVAEFFDQESGAKDDRPGWTALTQEARDRGTRRFDAVVIYQTSRLSRDRVSAGLFHRELRKVGVQIHYAIGAGDPSTAEGGLLIALQQAFDEYERAKLPRETKRGMRQTALQGFRCGGRPPYGYKLVTSAHPVAARANAGEVKTRLEPDPAPHRCGAEEADDCRPEGRRADAGGLRHPQQGPSGGDHRQVPPVRARVGRADAEPGPGQGHRLCQQPADGGGAHVLRRSGAEGQGGEPRRSAIPRTPSARSARPSSSASRGSSAGSRRTRPT